MIVKCLLLCIGLHAIAVSSQDDACSISLFTRKTCRINVVFSDSEACINAGCCFDSTSGIPVTGRCYKKGSTSMFNSFDFQPTDAPKGGHSGVLTVGGEPGYPGSELVLECKPSETRLCVSHEVYQDERSTCVRQGCCWRSGRCYQQTWKILRLRNKCPPGFEDPPACHVTNPCDDSPCLNGGNCVFTGPGKFRCDCAVGFAGVICDNCRREQLPISRGRRVPDKAEYMEAEYMQLECDANHAPQDGAVASRQCRDSNFVPPWSTHPFTCRAKCEVTKVDNAESNRDVASGAVVSIKHGEDVTYACKNTFTSAAGTKLTRTCEDGILTPTFDTEKIICNSDCVITTPDFSSTTATTSSVHHGEGVEFNCLDTHRGSPVESTTRTCENGVLKPDFTSEIFLCIENCKAVAPTDGSVKGGKTDLKHTEGVEIECGADHILEGISSGSCDEGRIKPALTAVCKKPCDILTVDGSSSQPPSGKVVHQASVVYTCNPNYKTPSSTDQFTSKCVDGVFTPPLETCLQQCQISEITNVKSVPAALEYIDHGEKVEFSCDKEFHTLDTMTERTCKLGNLHPEINAANPFSCHADCKTVPDFARSEFTVADRVKHGDEITIGCESGHTLVTDAVTRTCISGSYSPDLATKPATCQPIFRSCKDVFEKSFNQPVTDGVYAIRPSDSLPAFDVECAFSGDTAYNTIEHDQVIDTNVPTCNGSMCYNSTVNYKATIPEMRALIDLLGTCKQFIQYWCKGSMLFGTVRDAGWENWKGVMRHYWGGSDGYDGFCACGLVGLCADPTHFCNCNKNDYNWREDSGYLRQQNDLPVTVLHFGDTEGDDEEGFYTLGALKCLEFI